MRLPRRVYHVVIEMMLEDAERQQKARGGEIEWDLDNPTHRKMLGLPVDDLKQKEDDWIDV